MANTDVQNVTVTEITGTDVRAEFPLQEMPVTTVQGTACYKTVIITPLSARLIPDLDDLEEIILPAPFNETTVFELSPVQGG